jgi:hypothetical protein
VTKAFRYHGLDVDYKRPESTAPTVRIQLVRGDGRIIYSEPMNEDDLVSLVVEAGTKIQQLRRLRRRAEARRASGEQTR